MSCIGIACVSGMSGAEGKYFEEEFRFRMLWRMHQTILVNTLHIYFIWGKKNKLADCDNKRAQQKNQVSCSQGWAEFMDRVRVDETSNYPIALKKTIQSKSFFARNMTIIGRDKIEIIFQVRITLYLFSRNVIGYLHFNFTMAKLGFRFWTLNVIGHELKNHPYHNSHVISSNLLA